MRKIAITGPREPPDGTAPILERWVDKLDRDNVVYHGGAVGVDQMVRDLCRGLFIADVQVRPNYKDFPGPLAPLVRNAEMVSRVDEVVGFWRGQPFGGTANALWAAHRVMGRKPDWHMLGGTSPAQAEQAFQSLCRHPPAHWLDALGLWERSK